MGWEIQVWHPHRRLGIARIYPHISGRLKFQDICTISGIPGMENDTVYSLLLQIYSEKEEPRTSRGGASIPGSGPRKGQYACKQPDIGCQALPSFEFIHGFARG
jgi:hypothetical protein